MTMCSYFTYKDHRKKCICEFNLSKSANNNLSTKQHIVQLYHWSISYKVFKMTSGNQVCASYKLFVQVSGINLLMCATNWSGT